MQAIITKYICMTETKPARIKAECASGSIVIPYDYDLDGSAKHRKAAEALREKLGWTGDLVGGAMPNDSGYAFVFGESQD